MIDKTCWANIVSIWVIGKAKMRSCCMWSQIWMRIWIIGTRVICSSFLWILQMLSLCIVYPLRKWNKRWLSHTQMCVYPCHMWYIKRVAIVYRVPVVSNHRSCRNFHNIVKPSCDLEFRNVSMRPSDILWKVTLWRHQYTPISHSLKFLVFVGNCICMYYLLTYFWM